MSSKKSEKKCSGRYEVGSMVGSGSYSVVVKAFDEKLRRIVCLKMAVEIEGFSYEERVRTFRTEADVGASLCHPNIVRILDFTFQGGDLEDSDELKIEAYGEPVIVMDYIEGTKLGTFADKNELSISRIVDIGIQITKALDYTHNLKVPVIHRDIRGDNILINKEGHVYVTDWGVSRRGKSVITTYMGKGTYGYMAPEVMDIKITAKLTEAFKPIDARADLFSLGVLLYKLIGGELPFKSTDNPMDLRKEIHEQTYPKLLELNPMCPEVLDNIIIKLIQERREDRYENASLLLEDLQSLVKVVGSAPGYDCHNIIPEVILKKPFYGEVESEEEILEEQTTHVPDAPQEFIERISPRFKKYGVGIMATLLVIFVYKFYFSTPAKSMGTADQVISQNQGKVIEASMVSSPSTPDQFEKLLKKKQQVQDANYVQKIRPNQTIEKLGDSMVVYAKDSPDQRGYASMKNYGIVVGTTFDVVITHEIETSNISSPVRALLTKDVIIKGKLVFPKNSRFLGSAVGDGNERIQIMFDRIILPDNKEVAFDGSALDENGAMGIKGKVDREKTKRISTGGGRVAASAASGALDAMTSMSLGGQVINSGGKEAVDLTQEEVEFKNQATTVVKLGKDVACKVYVKRSF